MTIMDNLLGYGVIELTTKILAFYHTLLPSYHETLAKPFFQIVVTTFYSVKNNPEINIINTLM